MSWMACTGINSARSSNPLRGDGLIVDLHMLSIQAVSPNGASHDILLMYVSRKISCSAIDPLSAIEINIFLSSGTFSSNQCRSSSPPSPSRWLSDIGYLKRRPCVLPSLHVIQIEVMTLQLAFWCTAGHWPNEAGHLFLFVFSSISNGSCGSLLTLGKPVGQGGQKGVLWGGLLYQNKAKSPICRISHLSSSKFMRQSQEFYKQR